MRRALALLALATAASGCTGGSSGDADSAVSIAQADSIADVTTYVAGDLRIRNVVAPKPANVPGGAPPVAVYFTVQNVGAQADTLAAVEITAGSATLHQQTGSGGGMETMVPLAFAVVPPGETVRFLPGGRHVMIEGLVRPLEVGEVLPMTMVFRRAGRAAVGARVITYGDLDAVLAPDEHTGH